MAEHGTRTMYVHHGCRCEACCKAEHEQYLKRPEAKKRKRTYSKWGDIERRDGAEIKHERYARRYAVLGSSPIHWSEIAADYGMRCAICGCEVDPSDTWVNPTGRRCFGGRYPTVDHIVPLKLGGADDYENVQLACKRCNSRKGANPEVRA